MKKKKLFTFYWDKLAAKLLLKWIWLTQAKLKKNGLKKRDKFLSAKKLKSKGEAKKRQSHLTRESKFT